MARYRCPSCGRPFNGRKCRQCHYEVFGEEIAHRLHTHKREPLVIKSNTQRPAPRRKPYDRRTRKKPSPLWILLLFLFLNPILSSLMEETGPSSPAPDYPNRQETQAIAVAVPEGATLVYEDADFTVWLNLGGEGLDFRIPVIVENRTEQDVHAGALQIVVDGFLTENSSMYCEAPADCISEGILSLSEQDLSMAGITRVSSLSFTLNIYDGETYEDLLFTEISGHLVGTEPGQSVPISGEPSSEREK